MSTATVPLVGPARVSILGPSGHAIGAAGDPAASDATGPTLVLRLEAPIMFLNAGALRDAVRDAVGAASPRPTTVVLDRAAASGSRSFAIFATMEDARRGTMGG